jgi:hypothetical protein
MNSWTDKEIDRASKRIAMFIRRGAHPDVADRIADRLAARDQERDDRRMCCECAHLQQDGGCFMARRGQLSGVSRGLTPIRDLLQRCARFEWQNP